MNEKMVIKNPNKFGEVIEDIEKAIADAGGCISLPELFKMTVLEFLAEVASLNGIRFYFNRKFTTTKCINEEKNIVHVPPICSSISEITINNRASERSVSWKPNVPVIDEEEDA